jgi:hypothetical protein
VVTTTPNVPAAAGIIRQKPRHLRRGRGASEQVLCIFLVARQRPFSNSVGFS